MGSCFACGEDLLSWVRPFKPLQLVGCRKCLNISLLTWEGDTATIEPLPDCPTLGTLAPRGSVMAGVMEIIPDLIPELPILPEIPQRVVATIHDPIASIQDVVQIVEEDAVLSTKILSVANSAYFATVSEIGDLSTACSRLGMRALANIAHTVASANQYKSPNPQARMLMERLWKHAIATALCSETIATTLKLDSNLPYMAGLMHDIGKAVMVDAITTKYTGNVGRLKEAPDVLARAIDPFAPLIGLHVAQHWNLQGELFMTTFYTQNPDATVSEPCKTLTHCVRLASDMAEAKGYGVSETPSEIANDHPSFEKLGVTPEQFEKMSEDLDEMLDSVVGAYGSMG